MADIQRFAPVGTVWVCRACGKTHTDRYGIDGTGSRGWDESCALNAVLCLEQKGFNGWQAVPVCDVPVGEGGRNG